MDSGIHVSRFTFRGGINKLVEIDIAQLRNETAFPFMVMISQHVFEQISEAKLASKGVTVFRNRRAVGISEAPRAHGLEVSFQDGAVVRAQYVVGADGSQSTVRELVLRSWICKPMTLPCSRSVILQESISKTPTPASLMILTWLVPGTPRSSLPT